MKEISIENCPDKHYYVEFLVFKNFIAAIKRHGMYPKFRCVVGCNTNNCVSTMYKSMRCFDPSIRHRTKENIFVDAGNLGEFLKMMVGQFGGKCGSDFANKQDGMLQRHIANCTNMLIHVFVETWQRDFGLLSEIGGEIFNATCTEIFGDGFVDTTEPTPEEAESIQKIQELVSAGKLPKLSPEMMERLKQMVENNRNMYGDVPNPEGVDWMYDDEDYDYDADLEEEDEEWAAEEEQEAEEAF